MKFLIAGLGSIGRRHLRNLQALGERDIILYRTANSTLPDEDLAGLPVENDLATALAHQPDAVIISNPTAFHLDVAVPAAQAGCHLLLEKPVSHSWEGIEDFQHAVQGGGGKVLVGFQFRFHPGLQSVARLLSEGSIGRPLSGRAHWGEYLPDWHPWEDYRQAYSARAEMGGGVVHTLCHPLDYLRWLFGDPLSLSATLANSRELDIDVEDTADIDIQFEGDFSAAVHLDFLQRPPSHHLEITGSDGAIRWDNDTGAVDLSRLDSKRSEIISPPEDFERNHLFLAEMRHFLEVTHGKAEPLCTLADGLAALQLALAAHRSHRSGEVQHLEVAEDVS